MKVFTEKQSNWVFIPTVFYVAEPMHGFCGDETRYSIGLQFGPYSAGVEWTK